ncbi:MAG: ParB/Srx family N-terminal domain-containing protein, partial [Anaerovibrio sp.]|nr:ParB/Srx family N-terminal domain-containing protein [Anaerovibrio sp.]
MSELKYELVDVDRLIPYINNARTHSKEQVTRLASSIKEFGFINPVITDGEHGILAGHGRIMAAKQLGIKQVPCISAAYLTEAQKKAYILADNRLPMDAGWDNDLLKIEIESLQG